MPRKSSGGKSRAPARSPPAPAPAATQNRSIVGTIGSVIAEGWAFGAGNAVAHRVADAIMGPRTFRHENVPADGPETDAATATASSHSDACGMHYKAFQDCINISGSDISKCQFYMNMLSECRKGSGLAA